SPVPTGSVKERRVEEERIPFLQRQLHEVRLEVIAEILATPCKIAFGISLRERQKPGWPAFHRHVAMSDRALQREKSRHRMHMGWVTFCLCYGLEAEMVVPMRLLRLAAGTHDIHLRRDLKARTEPRLGHRDNRRARIVAGEHRRSTQAQLFLRIPDPVIRARFREVVSG